MKKKLVSSLVGLALAAVGVAAAPAAAQAAPTTDRNYSSGAQIGWVKSNNWIDLNKCEAEAQFQRNRVFIMSIKMTNHWCEPVKHSAHHFLGGGEPKAYLWAYLERR